MKAMQITDEQVLEVAKLNCAWKYGDSPEDNLEWINENPRELKEAREIINMVLGVASRQIKVIDKQAKHSLIQYNLNQVLYAFFAGKYFSSNYHQADLLKDEDFIEGRKIKRVKIGK